jgi:CBS domain-containing protein/acyl dehydratase
MLVPVAIREVMNERVETIEPDTDTVAVAKRLHGEGIGSLVVVRDGGPVGMITESDMARLVAQEYDPNDVTAADCMSAPVITIDIEDSIELAVELFRTHRIEKLPVLENGDLIGIITTTDLSYYLPHLARREAEQPSEGERHTRDRVDTAYERDDWEFESVGAREDRIDVGDVVRFSKELSAEDVEAFAEASGDTNRLHLDEEYAAGTRFGERIAHGTLAGGLISAAIARLPGLIVYLSQDTSYLGPIPVGSRATAVCEIVESLGNERYRLTTSVVTEGDDQVIDGEAVVLADPISDSA